MAKARSGLAGRLALGVGSVLLAIGVPSSVVAVGLLDDGASLGAREGFSFTPASVDPRLAELVAARRDGGKAPLMRFTPAGTNVASGERSVTVAVRIDQQVADAISNRGSIDSTRDRATGSGLRIAPTRYNLGLARGYSSFAKAPALSATLSGAGIPDLSEFEPAPAAAQEPSRFAARIELEKEKLAGRTSDTAERLGDQMLDLGGSYRLTRNLDVTAGVRYQQDRDLRPLPEMDKQDSQAVYIGTQFRF